MRGGVLKAKSFKGERRKSVEVREKSTRGVKRRTSMIYKTKEAYFFLLFDHHWFCF